MEEKPIYRRPEPKEKLSYDFPSAGELKKKKERKKIQAVLDAILSELEEEDSSIITYMGVLSDECIKFLSSKGYSVKKKEDALGATHDGDILYFYEISY